LTEIERTGGPHAAEVEAERQALEIYMAGPLRHVPVSDTISVLGNRMPAINWSGERKERLDRLLEEHPGPSDEEVAEARATLGDFIVVNTKPPGLWKIGLDTALASAVAFVLALMVLVPLYLIFGFVFRGGISHRLLGLALVRPDGCQASRLCCLFRSLVVWAPLITCIMFFLVRIGNPPSDAETGTLRYWGRTFVNGTLDGSVQVAAIILFFIGVIWTIVRPTRGLQDLVARTHVVPR
jgi:hypothetical protein